MPSSRTCRPRGTSCGDQVTRGSGLLCAHETCCVQVSGTLAWMQRHASGSGSGSEGDHAGQNRGLPRTVRTKQSIMPRYATAWPWSADSERQTFPVTSHVRGIGERLWQALPLLPSSLAWLATSQPIASACKLTQRCPALTTSASRDLTCVQVLGPRPPRDLQPPPHNVKRIGQRLEGGQPRRKRCSQSRCKATDCCSSGRRQAHTAARPSRAAHRHAAGCVTTSRRGAGRWCSYGMHCGALDAQRWQPSAPTWPKVPATAPQPSRTAMLRSRSSRSPAV